LAQEIRNMNAIRIETTIQADGELHLTQLPYRRGDKVEAIVLGPVDVPASPPPDSDREKQRAAAVEQFLALARASTFRSNGPYPTRDELHERN
jgi:hypothetical protein